MLLRSAADRRFRKKRTVKAKTTTQILISYVLRSIYILSRQHVVGPLAAVLFVASAQVRMYVRATHWGELRYLDVLYSSTDRLLCGVTAVSSHSIALLGAC